MCTSITALRTCNKSVIPRKRWRLQRDYSVSTHENKVNYVKILIKNKTANNVRIIYTRILVLALICTCNKFEALLFSGFRSNLLTQHPSCLTFAMTALFQNFVNWTRIHFVLNTEESSMIERIRKTSILIGKNLFEFFEDFLTRFC